MASSEITAASPGLTFSIARMTEHDLLEVVEIEELSGLSAWGWEAYHKELQTPDAVIMLVAKAAHSGLNPNNERSLAGFIVTRLLAGELHINNVAVRPEFRRQQVARQLLKAALGQGSLYGALLAFLEVREGNVAAQGLYRRCGFRVVGRRKNYYRQPPEDALLMSLLLEGSP